MTHEDFKAWRRVEEELASVARHLCARYCTEARDQNPCVDCFAEEHEEWRRNAIRTMKRSMPRSVLTGK